MTVPTQTIKVTTGAGNGVATVWPFNPVVVYSSADIQVTLVLSATGVETPLVLGAGAANFSVTVANYPGTGSVTYPADEVTPMPSTHHLVIKGVLTLEQQTNLENQGGYNPETLEIALDKSIRIDQQQQEEIGRSVKLPVSSGLTSLEIANPAALELVGWNAAGDRLENSGVTGALVAAAEGYASAAAASAVAAAAIEQGLYPWPTILTQDAESDSTILFRQQMTSAFKMYAVVLTDIETETSGEDLYMRFYAGNVLQSGSTYSGHLDISAANSASYAGDAYLNQTAARLNIAQFTGATGGHSGIVFIPNPSNAAMWQKFWTMGGFVPTVGTHKKAFGSGHLAVTGAIDGVQFFYSSGNIVSGTFSLMGAA